MAIRPTHEARVGSQETPIRAVAVSTGRLWPASWAIGRPGDRDLHLAPCGVTEGKKHASGVSCAAWPRGSLITPTSGSAGAEHPRRHDQPAEWEKISHRTLQIRSGQPSQHRSKATLPSSESGCWQAIRGYQIPLHDTRCTRWDNRHIIISPTIKQPASSFLVSPSPLLKEEPDVLFLTLLLNIKNPIFTHWPGSSATLTTHD